jgi:pimeloyl-ACP methyl ester carboxylesterase
VPWDNFLQDHIGELRTRTLILWGKEDTLVPIDVAEAFRDRIPGAQLIVYEDCGHVPMEEVSERSAAAVRAFMQSP